MACVHFHTAFCNLPGKRRIRTEQELLACLAFCIKGPAYLNATKRPVVELAAVVAGKGNTLGNALVDDVRRDFRQAVYVGFAATVIAPFDRIVEETERGVSIILIVLRGIDSPLRGNGVRAARGVLEAKGLYIVPQLGQGGGGGASCEPRSDHNDINLTLVCGADQRNFGLVFGPFFRNGTFGNMSV